MILNWHKSESMDMPLEELHTPEHVFIRKNIEEREHESEGYGPYTYYVYDEVILTAAEYACYLAEKNKAEIDYICMEEGIEI